MKTPVKTIAPELISMKYIQAACGGRSRGWVYDQLRSDPTFPHPVKTGPHSISFRKSELDAWIAQLPRAPLDGIDAVTRRQQAKRGGEDGTPTSQNLD